jgi:predicted transcriptional regulator
MRERRSRDRIIYEILRICAEGENITRIVYQANTNFTTIRAYLDMLINKDLVEVLQGSPVLYRTTQKGVAMRNHLRALCQELDDLKP